MSTHPHETLPHSPALTEATCIHCSYDLRGIGSHGVCPECGKPISDSTRIVGGSLAAWEARRTAIAARFAAHSISTWIWAIIGVIVSSLTGSLGLPLVPAIMAAVVALLLCVLHLHFTRRFLANMPGDASVRLRWMPAAGVVGILMTLGLFAVVSLAGSRPWPASMAEEMQSTLYALFVCLGCTHVSIVMSMLRPYARPVLEPAKATQFISTAGRARSTFLFMVAFVVVRWTPLYDSSWVRLGALVLWCMVIGFAFAVADRLKRLSKALDTAWKVRPAVSPAQPASLSLPRMSTTPSTSGSGET
ncbi:MAG: hypothetical protein DYG92_13110 [Leptolyngbya sp. PLA1]|nr:hypothetical protein [Leptolyngbya sp. PLA1]